MQKKQADECNGIILKDIVDDLKKALQENRKKWCRQPQEMDKKIQVKENHMKDVIAEAQRVAQQALDLADAATEIRLMPRLINLGRLKKQQNLAERSCTKVTLTKDSEGRRQIICRGRRKESKKGLRFDQNILLNIPVQRVRPKEVEITQRRYPKPIHIKFTWNLGNIYLFDIGRVKLKKRINAVHVKAFPSRDIVYEQDNQLSGLRDKPITQQDALPRSELPPRCLPGQDPLSVLRHPICHTV
ncbi:hypothetical protein GQ457_12G013860 [Hibiscus cannabinus]